MKKVLSVFVVLFMLSGLTNAQFQEGKHHVGPSIGYAITGLTTQFGANYEYGMNIGSGIIGIGGIFRYWSYGEAFLNYSFIVIGAQGNYHFGNGKFDPYVGLTLAYNAGSLNYDGPFSSYLTPAHGGIWAGFNLGARYWFSPNIAAGARLGIGSNMGIDLGVDFKF